MPWLRSAEPLKGGEDVLLQAEGELRLGGFVPQKNPRLKSARLPGPPVSHSCGTLFAVSP